MAKKQFKAESKRLLDLMINSIYTHKEIFLRELISNASDATDKLYYNAMKEGKTGITRDSLPIELTLDKENRKFVIEDHGCGMTAEELESNLGTIARSGSLAFKKENENMDDVDIIGQFGVGFYAAFMVASHVEVVSRAAGSDEANRWESDGTAGYTVTPCEKAENGTKITLTIKENTESENYDEFLEPYRVQGLVKKYSDYIRYPIRMDMTRSRMKEKPADAGEDYKPEWEEYVENVTLNSMVPIWKKSKKELTDEDYNSFYTGKFYDYQPPLLHIHTSVEGAVTYTAMLFIPSHAPMDYYTKDFEKGLQLYSNGVLIMDKCACCPTISALCAAWWTRPTCRSTSPARCSSTTATSRRSRRVWKRRSRTSCSSCARTNARITRNSGRRSAVSSSTARMCSTARTRSCCRIC